MKESKTKDLVIIGMFAAVLAVLSQIAIPMPSGVPVTLQTFAVALTGYVLGWKKGTAATVVYVLLGAVGIPVFSGFSGGIGTLLNMTGGFIFGFIFMAALCGVGTERRNKALAIVFGIAGLAVCHMLGILQFAFVMKNEIAASALMVSVPYLLKDVISVVAALLMGEILKKALNAAGILTYAKA